MQLYLVSFLCESRGLSFTTTSPCKWARVVRYVSTGGRRPVGRRIGITLGHYQSTKPPLHHTCSVFVTCFCIFDHLSKSYRQLLAASLFHLGQIKKVLIFHQESTRSFQDIHVGWWVLASQGSIQHYQRDPNIFRQYLAQEDHFEGLLSAHLDIDSDFLSALFNWLFEKIAPVELLMEWFWLQAPSGMDLEFTTRHQGSLRFWNSRFLRIERPFLTSSVW